MTKGKQKLDKSCKILELPDCVLRLVISYLDATSLYQLARTCEYLKYFVEDATFWKYIDAREEPNSDEKIHYCFDKIHEKTSHLLFRARDKNYGQIPANFFDHINSFKNIKVLALENQRLNGAKVTLKQFPTLLEELSLKKTHIKNSDFFFQHSYRNMQKLRVLILDGCRWVTCGFIMSIEKYESLEIISAVKCLHLHIDMVPYLCVARFGCKKLKVFDCRFTGIGHELLRCFYPKELIQSLYFQSFKSAELDYGEKYFNNTYMDTVTYSNDNNVLDTNIYDDSLIEYVNAIASETVQAAPSSLLYKDPYPNCACGYKGQKRQLDSSIPEITEDYYISELRHHLMRFVCKKHLSDVQKLPNEFKEFFVANQKLFYTDMNSDIDSDSNSSDSDSDNSCCMYGMGRKMVLLTLGNNENDVSVHREVLQLSVNDQGDRTRNLPDVSVENISSSEDGATPSTSRAVTSAEPLQKVGQKRKRKLSENTSEDGSLQTKRVKPSSSNDLNEANDEICDQVNELVESAADMGNRLNKFIQNSMDELNSRPARQNWQESVPSTSGVTDDAGQSNEGAGNQQQETKIWVIVPSKKDSARHGNTADTRSRDDTATGQSESPESTTSESQENAPYVLLRTDPTAAANTSPRQPQSIERLVTFRSKELTRFINPLHQINRYAKKKLGLRRLSLRGFKRITDTGLNYIQNLNLDLLDLTYTSVTEEGIEDFLVHNPSCRIIHPLYCRCKPVNPF